MRDLDSKNKFFIIVVKSVNMGSTPSARFSVPVTVHYRCSAELFLPLYPSGQLELSGACGTTGMVSGATVVRQKDF